MPAKPVYRRTQATKKSREVASHAALEKLFDIPRYDRNEVTLGQINRIRDLVDLVGGAQAAERVGVGETALLRLCAGFGHRNSRKVAAKIREFLTSNKK